MPGLCLPSGSSGQGLLSSFGFESILFPPDLLDTLQILLVVLVVVFLEVPKICAFGNVGPMDALVGEQGEFILHPHLYQLSSLGRNVNAHPLPP